MSDPLSDILTLVDARSVLSAGLTAATPFALRFHGSQTLKLGAVLMGEAWLQIEGQPPVRLRQGDCYLMTGGWTYTLATDLSLPAVDGHEVFAAAINSVAYYGGIADFILVAGKTTLDPIEAPLLLDLLPPLLHIPYGSAEAEVLTWLTQQLSREMRDRRPGYPLAASHLFSLMFMQVLRTRLTDASASTGWLAALADERLAPAMRGIHAEPSRRWTVAELARLSGMSRSAFAARFRDRAGRPPLDYLLHWRMRRAAERLRHDNSPILPIALAAGYDSESAFSNAFKRIMGQSPGQYRRN